MNEPAITAEDLTLYALHALDGTDAARVELLLRSSTEAREELSTIRGDLAAFALSVPQHTPPALSRQRLLKQVARERRTVPIPVSMHDAVPFALDAATPPALTTDPTFLPQRSARSLAEERRSKVRLPRIVAAPEPMFSTGGEADSTAAPDNTVNHPDTSLGAGFGASFIAHRDPDAAAARQVAPGSRAIRSESGLSSLSVPLPQDGPQDRYLPSTAPLSAYSEPEPKPSVRLSSLFAWTGWAAAAALAAVSVFAVRTNFSLHEQLNSQKATLAQTSANMARADLVLQTIQSSESQRFVLARQDTAPVPAARVAYLPAHGSLVFQATNLEPLPPYKSYELWLIPAGKGRQPIAAGTFKPDNRGYATLVLPPLPKGTVAGNFGVTIEDEAGSTAPTLPILLIGQQG